VAIIGLNVWPLEKRQPINFLLPAKNWRKKRKFQTQNMANVENYWSNINKKRPREEEKSQTQQHNVLPAATRRYISTANTLLGICYFIFEIEHVNLPN